jgi:hypothetical protein
MEFKNPFKPGAGHMPPYLAGRQDEEAQFRRLLGQDTIIENLILTGLRGLGKTVLLETFKPIALSEGWLWVGTDFTESASVSEQNFALRIITDLSVVTSSISLNIGTQAPVGFGGKEGAVSEPMNYAFLSKLYDQQPGLVTDKLKAVLEFVWSILQQTDRRGVIFAYDEAQNLSDHAGKEQYPLSVMLDVFQSIQRKDIPFMLALSGLPTLLPKLVEARTFAERMFRVVSLQPLERDACKQAIETPTRQDDCPFAFTPQTVEVIADMSGGYPYFVQFICREVFDLGLLKLGSGDVEVPVEEITRKLDTDFFAGRWAKATDRQRELLWVISTLANCDGEFSVQEIVVQASEQIEKGFTSSHVNQMLATLTNIGLIYKNRYGKYMFAVPLMAAFLKRQAGSGASA